MKNLMEHSVTISIHNTTQNIQIQGGSLMSDGSTSAMFLLNNYFVDLFKSKSVEHKDIVSQFNTALSELGRKGTEHHHPKQQYLSSHLYLSSLPLIPVSHLYLSFLSHVSISYPHFSAPSLVSHPLLYL